MPSLAPEAPSLASEAPPLAPEARQIVGPEQSKHGTAPALQSKINQRLPSQKSN